MLYLKKIKHINKSNFLKSKEKIIYLESLRGIACVLVVIYHYKICDFFYLPETVWICMEFFLYYLVL